MNCRACEDLLQAHLDGDPEGALFAHLSSCHHCEAHRRDIARLTEGLARLAPPTPPVGLADRLTQTLTTEARLRRVRRWRVRAGVIGGLAAAVLVSLGVWVWSHSSPTTSPSIVVHQPKNNTPTDVPPPLRDHVVVASNALVTFTRNTANDTVERSSSVFSVIPTPSDVVTVSTPIEPQLEEPLREAAGGVTNGLAPMADSARRAVSLFFRDLPGNPQPVTD